MPVGHSHHQSRGAFPLNTDNAFTSFQWTIASMSPGRPCLAADPSDGRAAIVNF